MRSDKEKEDQEIDKATGWGEGIGEGEAKVGEKETSVDEVTIEDEETNESEERCWGLNREKLNVKVVEGEARDEGEVSDWEEG